MNADPELPGIAMHEPFFAVVRGARARFVKVEHMNIGPGWMCRELDGALPTIIFVSLEMTDVERITMREPR